MSRTVAGSADFLPRAVGELDVDVITAGGKPAAVEIQLTE
jgi:hypothetical protein